MAIISGTPGNDTITGTLDDDTITCGAGDDFLFFCLQSVSGCTPAGQLDPEPAGYCKKDHQCGIFRARADQFIFIGDHCPGYL